MIIITYTNKQRGTDGNKVMVWSMRTWVRSQVPAKRYFLIFLLQIQCTLGPSVSPYAINGQSLDLQKARSNAHHLKVHGAPWSTCSMGSERSTLGQGLLGQKSDWHLPFYFDTRPNSLFLFFLYFLLFNYFDYFLTQKLILFFIKTHKNQFHQI